MEIKMLRKIEVVSRLNKIRNKATGETLNVVPVLCKIEERQLRLFGLFTRMRDNHLNYLRGA